MKERVRLRPRRVEDKRIRDEVSHDHDRYVTVLKGTWWTGAGEVYKPETMVPIREGGFMFHPAVPARR